MRQLTLGGVPSKEEPDKQKPGWTYNRRNAEDLALRDLYLTDVRMWQWFFERWKPCKGTQIMTRQQQDMMVGAPVVNGPMSMAVT